ncbi:hypothetical protein D1Y84_07890 [Acidipila sp. EB88]|nr:hypothetical protein D1Y84_07890 [Acidipila sp. EB88]
MLPSSSLPLIASQVRAYFAPVNRSTGTPTLFDPAVNSAWNTGAPPSPWIDLGYITEFTRTSESTLLDVYTGVPSTLQIQAKQKIAASVAFRFASWSKLAMALASGSQHMNVVAPVSSASAAIASGAKGIAAVALQSSSTGTLLYPSLSMPSIQAGSLVVVDVDYTTQTGFVGSAVSGGYVPNVAAVGSDPDYVRRISFNISRVAALTSDGGFLLASPLLAGAPAASMKMQPVLGFVDREGGSFFQEWSALFLYEGVQGDKLFLHYPRLQASQGSSESIVGIASALDMVSPLGRYVALPIVDGNDNEQCVCYRTYIPAAVAGA